jgi:hypothetical protein
MTTTNPTLVQWRICVVFASIRRRSSVGSFVGGAAGAEDQSDQPDMPSVYAHPLKKSPLLAIVPFI